MFSFMNNNKFKMSLFIPFLSFLKIFFILKEKDKKKSKEPCVAVFIYAKHRSFIIVVIATVMLYLYTQ